MRFNNKGSVIIWALLAMIFLASFISTLVTNSKLQDTQDAMLVQAHRSDIERRCTTDFLGKAFEVLNQRTSVTPELNQSDSDKVMAEGKLFGFLVKLQTSDSATRGSQETINKFNRLVRQYFHSIQRYLTVLGRTNINQVVNPIPTRKAYEACLNQD